VPSDQASMSRNATTFTPPACWGVMRAKGYLCQRARPATGTEQGLIRSGKRAKKKPPEAAGCLYASVTENLV
jgi:hypothetical protein